MTKWIPLFAMSLLVLHSVKAQRLTERQRHYTDSIFYLMIENKIPVFDTLYRPISPKTMRERYCHFDTVINDVWTRPRFVDNVYHHSFDGVTVQPVLQERPYFDTLTFTKSPEYIVFQEDIHDDNGNYISTQTAFLLNRNATLLTPGQVKKSVLGEIKARKPSRKLARLVANHSNDYWTNTEIEIGNTKYMLDSCQSQYRLVLKPGFEFEQTYGKQDTFCATVEMEPHVKVGVEGDSEKLFLYMDKLQYCQILYKTGYWSIDATNLLLFDVYGDEILKFRITGRAEDVLELEMEGYKVKLARIADH